MIKIHQISFKILFADKFNEFGSPTILVIFWKVYRKLGQGGMFFTSIVITIIVSWGVINYWML